MVESIALFDLLFERLERARTGHRTTHLVARHRLIVQVGVWREASRVKQIDVTKFTSIWCAAEELSKLAS